MTREPRLTRVNRVNEPHAPNPEAVSFVRPDSQGFVVVVVAGVFGVDGLDGDDGFVVVVVATATGGPPPPLLLLDRIRIPIAMTTPAPTSQSNGGSSLSFWACFIPAAVPEGRGPVSADNAGNGPITIAALTSSEISALFTLSSPFWVILLLYHPGRRWSIRQTVPPHLGEDNTPLTRKDQEFKYPRQGKNQRQDSDELYRNECTNSPTPLSDARFALSTAS